MLCWSLAIWQEALSLVNSRSHARSPVVQILATQLRSCVPWTLTCSRTGARKGVHRVFFEHPRRSSYWSVENQGQIPWRMKSKLSPELAWSRDLHLALTIHMCMFVCTCNYSHLWHTCADMHTHIHIEAAIFLLKSIMLSTCPLSYY